MSTDLVFKANASGSQNTIFKQAFSLAKAPIIIAFFVTPIRFLLELFGLPENVIFIIGLLWLTLALAIYWGITFYNKPRSYLLLLLSFTIFSPISRIPVFILWWIDKNWDIGSHYSLFYDNWSQALISHVAGGALVQIIPGFLLGSITLSIVHYRNSLKKQQWKTHI